VGRVRHTGPTLWFRVMLVIFGLAGATFSGLSQLVVRCGDLGDLGDLLAELMRKKRQ
jgi:hypothetical protein